MSDEIIQWQSNYGVVIPANVKTATDISSYAIQLSKKDRTQISSAIQSGHYQMAINYLWNKTIAALKQELSTVGVSLLGEMLGKSDVYDDDNVDDILTTKDTIGLAEELGAISATDAMRLRHTHELITHFIKLDINASDAEDIDEHEAISSLKTCIKSVLGRPKVEVAKKFVDFRESLENESLRVSDSRVEILNGAPYFYNKLTVNVLMNAAKKNTGAALEHSLANINTIIPFIWNNLRDTEKWQIGCAYAEVYSDGKSTAMTGLKAALLKIKGFDFVPENLRSTTFVAAARSIINAHEGLNNFYNELTPVRNLTKLGTTIPPPALAHCMTALLCVVLGNSYGASFQAQPLALDVLVNLSKDRWEYYLNNALPSDTRILLKLIDECPLLEWGKLINKISNKYDEFYVQSNSVANLLVATFNGENDKVIRYSKALYRDYYKKSK